MAHTNPFFVTRGDSTRLINAANAAHAVTFALADQNVSVKAANGRAMSAFLAAGGQIETADAAPIDSTSLLRDRGLSKTADMVEEMGGLAGFAQQAAPIVTPFTLCPGLSVTSEISSVGTPDAPGEVVGYMLTDGAEHWSVDLNGVREAVQPAEANMAAIGELKVDHDAAALHTGHADEIVEEGTGKAARKAKLAGDVE